MYVYARERMPLSYMVRRSLGQISPDLLVPQSKYLGTVRT